jgi:hypothetical protein
VVKHPFWTLFILGSISLAYVTFFVLPPGPREYRDFDPAMMAKLHLQMWQDDAVGDTVGTFMSYARLLRERNKYSWFRAGQAAYYLASATSQFRSAHNHYQLMLPDLQTANAIERDWMGATFDPSTVAESQLAWWVSARRSDLNTLSYLSGLMSQEMALRYGGDQGEYAAAATLLARALELRLKGGHDADWASVGELLNEYYRELHSVLHARRGRRA